MDAGFMFSDSFSGTVNPIMGHLDARVHLRLFLIGHLALPLFQVAVLASQFEVDGYQAAALRACFWTAHLFVTTLSRLKPNRAGYVPGVILSQPASTLARQNLPDAQLRDASSDNSHTVLERPKTPDNFLMTNTAPWSF